MMEFAFIYCRVSASLCRQTDCTFRYHNVGNDLFLQMSTCSLMPTIFSHSTTIHRLKENYYVYCHNIPGNLWYDQIAAINSQLQIS